MKTKKPGIRIDLSQLWRKNMLMIMNIMKFTKEDVAEKMDVSRQSICMMLNRDDFHLTGIQFLGTIQGVKEMIGESKCSQEKKDVAYAYLEEVDRDYLKNGLH